jgi:hypothetical protein
MRFTQSLSQEEGMSLNVVELVFWDVANGFYE